MIVKTQKEFDALKDFKKLTSVYIQSDANTWIQVKNVPKNCHVKAMESSHVEAWGSSHVEAWGSSHVKARGSSYVEARESSHVEARQSSHVKAMESSHVEAMESSHVEAWGSSHVKAWGSSHVEARESSHVEAWGSSYVEAWESSHVEAMESSYVEAKGSSYVKAWESSYVKAWESSHVEARESSHVEAYMNSSIKTFSKYVKIEQLKNYATLICIDKKCIIKNKAKTANVIVQPKINYFKQIFKDIYKDNLINSKIIKLYKSVNPENMCDFWTNSIKYEGTVTCPDFDKNNKRECGGGLHLSPTPELALSYNQGKVLECEVKLTDLVIYPLNIQKVRCKKVKVIGEYKK